MNRRDLLKLIPGLSLLPFVGKVFARESSDERCARFAEDLIEWKTGDRVRVVPAEKLAQIDAMLASVEEAMK